MVYERNATADFGLTHWHKFFNVRQLLTLATYAQIIKDAHCLFKKKKAMRNRGQLQLI
jgi:adenine-specific DNA methylase